VSDRTEADHLTFEATAPMTREALVALVRRRASLWGLLPGFGDVVARATKAGFALRISDLAAGSAWTLLEAEVEDRGTTCVIRGRVGRDPLLWRWRVRNAIGVVLFLALLVVPPAIRYYQRGDWGGGAIVAIGVAWAASTLYCQVFPFGVARRELADRAFLVAWLEHKIDAPVTVRVGGAAG
jgi:hypothetical protein